MRLFSIFLMGILAMPAAASEEADGDEKSLMRQGIELFLQGLTEEVEPTLQELQDLAQELGPKMQAFFVEMGPALRELVEKVEDWSLYEAPEILPNGDIIIRRKPEDVASPPPEGQVDL